MIDLTVTPDRVHHRPTESKEETMTNELPDWANDPRGLPPVVFDHEGDEWKLEGDLYFWRSDQLERNAASLERDYGPCTALWPASTPNNTVLPDLSQWHEVPVGATIPNGTTYVSAWEDGSVHTNRAISDCTQRDRIRRFTEHPIPDPDADLVAALIEADSPEVARTLIGDESGIETYPVGLLSDLKRHRLRQGLRYLWVRVKERNWRACRSEFNGYLAEWHFPPEGVNHCRCGRGWTRRAALRSLGRHLVEVNLTETERARFRGGEQA